MPDFDTTLASDEFENSPLATVYYNVLNELVTARLGEGSTSKGSIHERRVALWVAWESHRIAPILEADNAQKIDMLTMVGLPKKQKDFAALLGVSDRTIRYYAEKYGRFVSTAQEMGVQRVLSRYDLPVLHALGLSAATPDGRNASDRRTFFTMRGFLVDKADITSGGGRLGDPEAEIIELLRNGRITPEDVIEELGPEDARKIIARANLASKGNQ